MSRLARLAVAITALASFLGVASATADAVVWHNTGSTVFTATGGPATLSVGANNLACTAMTSTGSQSSGSTTTTAIGVGTLVASPCSLVGQSAFVHCVYTTTSITFSAGVTVGNSDVTCDARLTASPTISLCHISGSTPGSYTNPIGTTKGRFTGSASSTLIVSNGNVSCPLGTGTGTLTERTGNVTTGTPTTLGPVINRTA